MTKRLLLIVPFALALSGCCLATAPTTQAPPTAPAQVNTEPPAPTVNCQALGCQGSPPDPTTGCGTGLVVGTDGFCEPAT
jgi:hypothetical protein